MYVEAVFDTPILSIKDFSKWMPKKHLILDELNLFRPLEMIAFKGSLFNVLSSHKDSKGFKIYEVEFESYPSAIPLYIDARFVRQVNRKVCLFEKSLPTRCEIISAMKNLVGLDYVWGGNAPFGVNEMKNFYPLELKGNIQHRTFAGVDCSGLLYYATNGITPRNTSELRFFGKGVCIEGLETEEIINALKPLDMVVWKGHVFFILDQRTTIESRVYRGTVYLSEIKERFERIYKDDGVTASNDPDKENGYVVRRWYF